MTRDLIQLEESFLFSKQLFNFRHHLTRTPEIDEESRRKIFETKIQIKELFKESISSAKRAKSQGRRSSQAPARPLAPITEDGALQASFESIHVLHPIVSTLRPITLVFFSDSTAATGRSDRDPSFRQAIRRPQARQNQFF